MMRFAPAAWLLFLPWAAFAQLVAPSYQGLWWKAPAASEAGWGLNIAHQGHILFATWFTYDADGRGLWLVMPRAEQLPVEYETDPYGYEIGPTAYEYAGTIYRTTGPAFDAPAFDPAAVSVTPVGSARLRFTAPDSGTFTYTVGGLTQSKAITRQVFDTPPQCGWTPGPSLKYQDLWWRSPAGSESGWGVNVAHQGEILFVTWFTYGHDGQPMWLVMSEGRLAAPATYSGTLYRTTGPPLGASPWDPGQVTVTPVGTATFEFSGPDEGRFSYTVDGASGSKPITRQVFAAPVSVCR